MPSTAKKSFFKLTPSERDRVAAELDREILLEETKPLSAKSKAISEKAKRAPNRRTQSHARRAVIR